MATETDPVPEIAEAIADAGSRKRAGRGMAMMASREADFGSRLRMQLAGMAYEPSSREILQEALTSRFAGRRPLVSLSPETFRDREVIIGAGYAAAVYAATRVRMGKPKPIVLERSAAPFVGGTFAWSQSPVWRLNSGNRPGPFGSPKDPSSSVNYLPGGVIQPSDLMAGDFGTNADMALVIRVALAQFAEVYPETTVTQFDNSLVNDGKGARITLANGDCYDFRRLLDARGLGDPSFTSPTSSLMAFPAFMKKMGEAWPLKGIRRAVVVGDGKSALCAAESLLGITPGISTLDRVQRVDLYGPNLESNYFNFRGSVRVRYLALAREIGKRLFIYNRRADPLQGLDSVVIGGTSYDFGVMCTGFAVPSIDRFSYTPFQGLATRANPLEIYRIGVRAGLPFSADEVDQGLSSESENSAAMFRYGPRVSALAAMLD